MLVDFHNDTVLIHFGALDPEQVVEKAVIRRGGKERKDVLGNRAERATRNHIVSERVPHLILVAVRTGHSVDRKWVVNFARENWVPRGIENGAPVHSELRTQQLREVPRAKLIRECGQAGVVRTGTKFKASIVDEEKCLVLPLIDLRYPNGPSEISSILVLLERRFLLARGVPDKTCGVQRVVLQVIVQGAVVSVCARLEGKRDQAIRKPVLCVLNVVDHLKLANGFNRRMVLGDIPGESGAADRNSVNVNLIRVADPAADVQAIVRRRAGSRPGYTGRQ